MNRTDKNIAYFHQANCASLRTEDGWHFPDCDCERIPSSPPLDER